jgi:hypothetical protein
MVGTTSDWEDELGRWLEPFLERLGHRSRQRMCPLYVAGLIGPGDRKSVQPMAERLAPGDYDQLHHFVAAGVGKEAPLETELLIQADKLVGGSDAVLVIDDTSMPKKGKHSVGVATRKGRQRRGRDFIRRQLQPSCRHGDERCTFLRIGRRLQQIEAFSRMALKLFALILWERGQQKSVRPVWSDSKCKSGHYQIQI